MNTSDSIFTFILSSKSLDFYDRPSIFTSITHIIYYIIKE